MEHYLDPTDVRELSLGIFFGGREFTKITALDNMSDAVKLQLKRLYADADSDHWAWDEGPAGWVWELLVCGTQNEFSEGYVSIVPLIHGEAFAFEVAPEPSHREWALRFVVFLAEVPELDQVPATLFLTTGTLPVLKRQLDALLGAETPEIPQSCHHNLVSN
jgi:hypothetical protein